MIKSMEFLLACFISVSFIACSKNEQKAPPQMPPMPVSAMKAQIGDWPLMLTFNGQTASELDIVIKAKVSGTLEKQLFTPGQSIKQGQALYQIDESKYKAAYLAAAATQKNASLEFNRIKSLKDKNAVAQKDYDTAQANANIANANLQNAKIDLDYSKVTAPFDGIVGDTKKDKGSYVTAGEELVRLSKLNPIFVKFGISDIRKLEIDNNIANGEWKKLDPKVSIIVDNKEFTGKLVFIDNVINANTATVDAKAVFDNPDLKLMPGIYTKVLVSGFLQKNSFKIPQKIVSQDPKGSYVFVVKDGVVDKKYIKIASSIDYDYIIKSGLEDGDILVMDNFKKINAGSKVQIINDPSNPTQIQNSPNIMQENQQKKQG